jgi:hypothetical protein
LATADIALLRLRVAGNPGAWTVTNIASVAARKKAALAARKVRGGSR